jgi:PilZ domain
MKSMNQRRSGQRIPMGLPVEIRWTSRTGSPKQAVGRTGNISGNGLFIEIPVRLQRETAFTMKVELPRKPAQGPLELLCQGRVVRWNRRGEVQGLGAVIDQYELRPLPKAETARKKRIRKGTRKKAV